MENVTNAAVATAEQTQTLASAFTELEINATQQELAAAIQGATLIQIAQVSNHGDRIAGSAERAVAAFLNTVFQPDCQELSWYAVEHRDGSKIGKELIPHKKELYTAWKSSNPSVKFARVKAYGRELAKPMLLEQIAKLPAEDVAAMMLANELQEETATEETTTTSKNRDLYERAVVELGKLFRTLTADDNDAVIKAHAKTAELSAALLDVTRALKALGAPIESKELKEFMDRLSNKR